MLAFKSIATLTPWAMLRRDTCTRNADATNREKGGYLDTDDRQA
jgi:hypothetical protein